MSSQLSDEIRLSPLHYVVEHVLDSLEASVSRIFERKMVKRYVILLLSL